MATIMIHLKTTLEAMLLIRLTMHHSVAKQIKEEEVVTPWEEGKVGKAEECG